MKRIAATAGMIMALSGSPAFADEPSLAEAAALPLATKRVPASADECAVWRRERSFAQSVEAHDKQAWAAHLHAGVIFNVGTADAQRGRDEVMKVWPGVSGGKNFVLRWRPGIVMIGGDPKIAVSIGPYVFQGRKEGVDKVDVGFYQTVWLRDESDGVWRVLFDGDASTAEQVADRAAANTWVAAQAMSDCSTSPSP